MSEIRSRPLTGVLLAVMIALSITTAMVERLPIGVAAALAWLALVSCWRRLSRQQQLQALVLLGVGCFGLLWGVARGVGVDLTRAFTQNQVIISLLASVSLLRLLDNAGDDRADTSLPLGRSAYDRSVVGVHLFGAVINISALVIVADRLSRSTPLSQDQALTLGRSFTMAVFYSPFIGGMALALAYNPQSSLSVIMLTGIPLAIAGLGMLLLIGRLGWVADLERFPGYPARFESLWLPATLALGVLILHGLFPSHSVLTLIIMLSPAMVVCVLGLRQGPAATGRTLKAFVFERLPEMSGELSLFLAAGVLGAGLVAVIATLGGLLPFDQFGAAEAGATLLLTVMIAFFGVHPVVMVTTAATVLTPLHPDPNLLAMVFVMGWGIGCAACPLSGTNLTLQGRYGVSSWSISRHNVGFALIMTALGSGSMYLYEKFL